MAFPVTQPVPPDGITFAGQVLYFPTIVGRVYAVQLDTINGDLPIPGITSRLGIGSMTIHSTDANSRDDFGVIVNGIKMNEQKQFVATSTRTVVEIFGDIDARYRFTYTLTNFREVPPASLSFDADGTVINADLRGLIDGAYLFYRLRVANPTFNYPLPELKNSFSMFQGTYITSFTSALPKLDNGEYMFNLSALVEFNVDLPDLIVAQDMFRGTQISTFNSALPKVQNGVRMFEHARILSFNSALPELMYGEWMFADSLLTTFNSALPKLTDGRSMFIHNKLQASEINKILGTLPTVTGQHIITFTGCPGAATCDTSIGTAKGWTVQI